jgi:hypothetical protein
MVNLNARRIIRIGYSRARWFGIPNFLRYDLELLTILLDFSIVLISADAKKDWSFVCSI